MFKILGNRVLVSKIEEPEAEGFKAVQVQDSFVYKGKIEQVGNRGSIVIPTDPYQIGDTILFAKYSPDTQEIEHEGKKYKIINVDDILAVI